MKLIKHCILIVLSIVLNKNVSGQGIVCNPNMFWGKTNSGNYTVNQYTITGNSVVLNSTTPANFGYSLAICNNFSGSLFSPTFYSGTTGLLEYYDGSSWVFAPGTPICQILNSAGYDNFLYTLDNGTGRCIERYTNNTFAVIYNDTMLTYTAADIAVDEIGNVWALFGQAFPYTEFIFVIDSTGQVIKQYPFYFNTGNAYGCFMLNGILYLGLGGSNVVYPNSLLPIIFSGNSATAGTPIPFVSNNNDLASCDPGNPLFLDESNMNDLGLLVYPTITIDNLNVIWNAKAEPGSMYELKIFDMSGRMMYEQSYKVYTDEFRSTIDVNNLSSGVYTMQLYSGNYHSFRKFIKN